MADLTKMESKYGSVVFEGKKYILCDHADFSNRVLNKIPNYQNQGDNGEYWFEMSARAVDESGNEYTVYWMFYCDDPERNELDSYDYDKADSVEER